MENIITSKDNPIIKLYQRLSSSKKERLQYGLFVLEGLRLVEDAVKEDAAIEHILVTEGCTGRYSDTLSQADLRNTKVIVISNELGKRISSTENTQGIFAVCHIPQPLRPESIFHDGGRYAVLCGLQDPGNVGMIIRTADALGIDGIISCQSCEIYNPKVVRSTMGSLFRMKIVVENDTDALFDMLEKSGTISLASVIDTDAVPVTSLERSSRMAVFIGNEGNGLPREVSGRCSVRTTIPMTGTVNSLNAAMAAGILMWEIRKI